MESTPMEELKFMARVAEQVECFDDMIDFLRPLVREKGGNISVEERDLLLVGIKNHIGGKKTIIRTIAAIEQDPKYSKFGGALGQYKKKFQLVLQDDCQKIINIIKQDALQAVADPEGKAFFHKIVGD